MTVIVNIKYSNAFINLELDTGESLKLAPEVFNMYSLSRGKILDNYEYQQLKEESIRLNCRQKALDYLAIRSRSYQEMQNYLIKKGFSKDIIVEILNGLKDSGYINDYEYAVGFINNKKKSKVLGKNLLKRDLYKKGINKDIVRKAVRETGADSVSLDEIFELALKKMNRLGNKKNKTAKIIFFLRQKGFEEDEIKKVIGRLKIEDNEQ